MSKTRIIEAVRHLEVDTTRALLDAKPALLHVTDRRGFNLLHLACCVPCGDLGIDESVSAKLVTLLLDRGLDVESQLPPKQDKCTALFFAGRSRRHQGRRDGVPGVLELAEVRGGEVPRDEGRRRQRIGSEDAQDRAALRRGEGIRSDAPRVAREARRVAGPS